MVRVMCLRLRLYCTLVEHYVVHCGVSLLSVQLAVVVVLLSGPSCCVVYALPVRLFVC